MTYRSYKYRIYPTSAWYGKSFVKIDRWFPSSKTCSACGHEVDKLPLAIREWVCPVCRTTHDRDHNAAINIQNEGLKDLYSFTSDEFADYKRGEELRPSCRVPAVLASSVKRLA
jgi:putative transposase